MEESARCGGVAGLRNDSLALLQTRVDLCVFLLVPLGQLGVVALGQGGAGSRQQVEAAHARGEVVGESPALLFRHHSTQL